MGNRGSVRRGPAPRTAPGGSFPDSLSLDDGVDYFDTALRRPRWRQAQVTARDAKRGTVSVAFADASGEYWAVDLNLGDPADRRQLAPLGEYTEELPAPPEPPAPRVARSLSEAAPPPLSREISDLGKDLLLAATAGVAPGEGCAAAAAGGKLEPGDFVDFCDGGDRWRVAQVLALARDEDGTPHVKLSVADAESESDEGAGAGEWVAFESGRILPCGQRSAQRQHPYHVGQWVEGAVRRYGVVRWELGQVAEVTNARVRLAVADAADGVWFEAAARPGTLRAVDALQRQSAAVQAEEDTFRALLAAQNMRVVPVDKDGNCLFRAAGHQIYGDPELHAHERAACANYVLRERAHFQLYADDLDAYVAQLRQPQTWGDHVEIQALSELHDRRVVIYSLAPDGDALCELRFPEDPVAGVDDEQPIRLSYHGSNHYNSVVWEGSPPPLGPAVGDGRVRAAREAASLAGDQLAAVVRMPPPPEVRRAWSQPREGPPGPTAELRRVASAGSFGSRGSGSGASGSGSGSGSQASGSPALRSVSSSGSPALRSGSPALVPMASLTLEPRRGSRSSRGSFGSGGSQGSGSPALRPMGSPSRGSFGSGGSQGSGSPALEPMGSPAFERGSSGSSGAPGSPRPAREAWTTT